MDMRTLLSGFSALFAMALLTGCRAAGGSDATRGMDADPDSNQALVQAAFDRWRSGTGGPFELLADDARWTIVGSSPLSKTYGDKEQFMAEVIRPFNARMEKPLKPTIRQVYGDGDTVVVVFDAESLCLDGRPYRNTYAWFIKLKNGRAVEVTAFLDTRLFDEMWARVKPKS